MRSAVAGDFYAVAARDATVDVELTTGPLPEFEIVDGELLGADVRVGVRAVLVRASNGELEGVPLEPIEMCGGALRFAPSRGGVRTRDNRLAAGGHNDAVAEATRFGMVNAFVHATNAAAFFNGLLADLGAPRLPSLPVIVSAHSGSRLQGYAQGDGDYRSGRMRPLSGAHYRVSQRTTGVPELLPVCPTGEVHLGPGRLRQHFAGRDGYVRAAAHNPATIYHEYGHHLCRHTADFRLNRERPPERQRNGKPGVEEGVCDYMAAALLGTGRPYGWYRADRGARRDPAAWTGLAEPDRSDPHEAGAPWAALWWRCRHQLEDAGLLSARSHDRAVVATLLALGEVAGSGDGARRRVRERRRGSPEVMLSAYLDGVRREGGVDAARRAASVARTAGVLDAAEAAWRAC
jgi:hypothetical protein